MLAKITWSPTQKMLWMELMFGKPTKNAFLEVQSQLYDDAGIKKSIPLVQFCTIFIPGYWHPVNFALVGGRRLTG